VSMIRVAPDDLPCYTVADHAAWDGDWELIGGIPYAMTPSPTVRHQSVAARFVTAFTAALESCEACIAVFECDWHVDGTTVLRPDVSVVCRVDPDGFITRAPEILVEILSPSTASRDHGLKRQLYEQAGVAHYLVVDPNTLDVQHHRLDGTAFDPPVMRRGGTLPFEAITCPFSIDLDKVLQTDRPA